MQVVVAVSSDLMHFSPYTCVNPPAYKPKPPDVVLISGAVVDAARKSDGNTCLFASSRFGFVDIVELLLCCRIRVES